MEERASKAELMRALGRLVRGLSALFWGLPLTLVITVKTATTDWLRPLGMLPAFLATALLFYGIMQLGYFQREERVWRRALERAQFTSLINVGLSPFIFWWNRLPHIPYFTLGVALLVLTSLIFLFNLNHLLQRLAAMLPDETLRVETRHFTGMNLYLICALVALFTLYILAQQLPTLPPLVIDLLQALEMSRDWLLIMLVLLPVAMTMSLIWKIKEVIIGSILASE